MKKDSKILYTDKDNIQTIIKYFNQYGGILNATVQLPNGKSAKIQPYGGMLEVISDDPDKINELEEILEKNE